MSDAQNIILNAHLPEFKRFVADKGYILDDMTIEGMQEFILLDPNGFTELVFYKPKFEGYIVCYGDEAVVLTKEFEEWRLMMS